MKLNQTLHTQAGGASRHRKGMTRLAVVLALTSILLMGATCGAPTPSAETTTEPAEPPAGQPPAEETQPPAPPEATEPPAPPPVETESPYAEGSMVRAAYDPAANWASPDVHEDFEGTSGLFADVAIGAATSFYDSGAFHITLTSRGWWTWYKGSTALTNFYVDIVVYNGDQCVDRDAGGLLYRYYQIVDFGLLFGVTCGGGYFLGVTGGPGPLGEVCYYDTSIIDCSGMWDHPTSEYIDAGPGAANRIGVKALGQQISLYINGHQVESMVIPSGYVFAGNFALYLGAGQRDNASVSFDDLSIWFNP